MFKLNDKSVVITGGGSGIGKAIAILFAKQGAQVHIIELSEPAAADAVSEITTNGGVAASYVCDVSKQQQVIDTLNQIGKIDILINNAGIAHIGRADNTSEADFDRIYNVNIKGVYNCLFAAIPLMKANKGGGDLKHSILLLRTWVLLIVLLIQPVKEPSMP